MKVLVLGAGVVGVTTAWYLARSGHQVTVIDRQPAPAQETSHANGSQISVCHAEPWANPAAPLKVLKWLGREDAPLLWRWRADPAQLAWGLRFLNECRPARTKANIAALVGLGLYSRRCLGELRDELALHYDEMRRGILHFYTDSAEFEHAIPQAALMRAYGCERMVKTSEECLDIEPALRHSDVPVVGGTYTPDDESGDARLFSEALLGHCLRLGVTFMQERTVSGLLTSGDRCSGVQLVDGTVLQADACVVALGSYSPLLLRPLGMRIPVFPAKGYSLTLALPEGVEAPSVSLTDDGAKLVFSRLGQRLRIAGTAEFCGYDTSLNPARLLPLRQRTATLFPQLRGLDEVHQWTGLRPATPGNLPLLGATRYRGLFLNTGHGTLGWTLACGSARLLTDLIDGRPPEVNPAPYLP